MKVNTTIDDGNPAITYLPAANWAEGTKTDPQWTQYYLGTYTMCSKLGDNATFSFFGTGVWIYGALRSNHGLYNVTLDGTTTTQDGFAAGTGLYQQVLFGASDLNLGQHSITITNNRNSTTYANLDIDFITFEESIGDGSDTLGTITDDDNAATFQYGPAATAWSTVPADPTQYHGQSGHTTVTSGAYVTYHFTGSSVSIYGPLGPSQGPYSVSVDGGAEVNYTATAATLQPQQLLYHGFFDGNNTHSIQITNRPTTSGQALDIDYAQVNFAQLPLVTSTSTSATSTSTTSSTSIDTSLDTPTVSSTPETNKKGVSTGVVVAAVVGALALIAMLSFALMMYRRRKQSKKDEDEPDMITVYPEPYTIGENGSAGGGPGRYIPPSQYMHDGYNPLHSGGPTPLYPPTPRGPFDQQQPFPVAGRQPGDQISIFSGAAPGMPRQPNNRPRFDSSSTGHGYTDVASTVPYGASTAPYGRDSAYTGVSDGSSRMPAHGHSTIAGGGPNYDAPLPPVPPLPTDIQRHSNPPLGLHQPPPGPPGIIPPTKGRRVSLPSTATQDLSNIGRDELAANRMRVDGREQDFGPILAEGSDPLSDHPLPLPPNYAQATETYKR